MKERVLILKNTKCLCLNKETQRLVYFFKTWVLASVRKKE